MKSLYERAVDAVQSEGQTWRVARRLGLSTIDTRHLLKKLKKKGLVDIDERLTTSNGITWKAVPRG